MVEGAKEWVGPLMLILYIQVNHRGGCGQLLVQ